MLDVVDLGRRIKELRLAKGIKRGDALAQLAGVSDSLVYEIERGEMGSRVALLSLVKIAHALDMNIGELLSGHATPDPDPQVWERIEKKLDDLATAMTKPQSLDELQNQLEVYKWMFDKLRHGWQPDQESDPANRTAESDELLRERTLDQLQVAADRLMHAAPKPKRGRKSG